MVNFIGQFIDNVKQDRQGQSKNQNDNKTDISDKKQRLIEKLKLGKVKVNQIETKSPIGTTKFNQWLQQSPSKQMSQSNFISQFMDIDHDKKEKMHVAVHPNKNVDVNKLTIFQGVHQNDNYNPKSKYEHDEEVHYDSPPRIYIEKVDHSACINKFNDYSIRMEKKLAIGEFQFKGLSQQLQDMTGEREKMQKKLEQQEKDLAQYMQSNVRLQEQLDALKSSWNEVISKNQELQDIIERQKISNKRSQEAFDHMKNKLQLELDQSQEIIKQKDESHNQLLDNLQLAKNEIENLQQTAILQLQENDELKSQMVKLKVQITYGNGLTEENTNRINLLQMEQERNNEIFKQFQLQIQNLQSENDSLLNQNEKFNHDLQTILILNEQLNKKLEISDGELIRIKSQYKKLQESSESQQHHDQINKILKEQSQTLSEVVIENLINFI